MLGKLLRYDSRVQMRFFGMAYAVMGIMAVVAAAARALYEKLDSVPVFEYVHNITWLFCRAAAVVLVIGSIIYVIAFFRKNLFKDEGYFVHTLPVAEWQIFASKLITGSAWIFLSGAVAVLGCMLGRLNLRIPLWSTLQESGLTEQSFVWLFVLLVVVSIPATLCQFYASLAIGYTLRGLDNAVNRDILSVAALLVTYVVQQVLNTVVLLVYIVWFCGDGFESNLMERFVVVMGEIDQSGSAQQLEAYVTGILGIALAQTILLGVVFSVIAVWRMHRHLNME